MYNKILGTFSSKVYSSAVSFLVIILTSRYLGPTGRGEISLFIANISLVQLFNEIIIGPAMVFLVSRHKTFHLLTLSFLWSFFISFVVILLIYITELSPASLIFDLFYLSVLYAFFSTTSKILQGKQEIKNYNILNIFQSTILIATLCFYFFILKITSIETYIYTLYIGYSIPTFISLLLVLKLCNDFNLSGIKNEFIIIIKTGFTAQINNFLSFLNTRLSYYIIALLYIDKSALGIFSLATSLVESVWLVSYSIAIIQYPIISASDNTQQGATLSVNLAKIAFWASSILIFIMLIIPESFYLLIFGNGFIGVKEIILLLSPGIITLSVSKIYWVYFSGTGNFKINNTFGLIGLVGTVFSSYILIKNFGIVGAAFSTLISHVLSGFYLFGAFRYYSGYSLKELLPKWNDYKLLKK